MPLSKFLLCRRPICFQKSHTLCRIIDQNMSDSAHQFPVLDNRAAAHTLGNSFTISIISNKQFQTVSLQFQHHDQTQVFPLPSRFSRSRKLVKSLWMPHLMVQSAGRDGSAKEMAMGTKRNIPPSLSIIHGAFISRTR